MLKKLLSLGVMAGALAFSQVAHATTLTSSIAGMLGQNVKNYYNNGLSSFNGWTGQQNNGVSGGPVGYPTSFVGYCVDIEHSFVNGESVSVQSTSLLTKNGNLPNSGYRVAWLYNTYSSSLTTNVQAAALQSAIWEALYDSSLDLTGGFYKLDATEVTVAAQANVYLGALSTAIGNGSYLSSNATWFNAGGLGQDIMGPNTGGVSQVPEPGLMSLLASGSVSGLWMLRRRKTKTR